MQSNSPAVLAERIRVVERDIKEIKVSMKDQDEDIEKLPIILHRLDGIERTLEKMNQTLSRDSGWRGFFLDFIKAAAQIAALVGAGKWIF